MSKKTTNKSRYLLGFSCISTIICLFLFAGTTYAWFSSEVEYTNNKIVSGNLDVEVTLNSNEIVLVKDNSSYTLKLFAENIFVNSNDKLIVSNIGTLNSVIIIDYQDDLIEDIIIKIDSDKNITYTLSDSGTINLYYQSQKTYSNSL